MTDLSLTKQILLENALLIISSRIKDTTTAFDIYKLVIDTLSDLPHFDWVGIYLVEGDELVLAYYKGKPTEHVRILKGKGICGSAWDQNKNIIVEDVRESGNYLACSLETRSEIVVLIKSQFGDKTIGQIDVDSDQVNAFNTTDEKILNEIASLISIRLNELGLT